MLRTALVSFALVASACSTTLYTEDEESVRIHFGGGGELGAAKATYDRIAATGKPVIIDGQVISADAFYAFSLPDACYTENAVFSPHAVSYLGLIPSRTYTRIMAERLPEPLEKWFKGNVAYYDWIGFAEVDYDQLREIWPEGECSADVMAMIMN